MIQPRVQFSLRNAREYFREHLSTGDYYSQGEKIAGEWSGHGAEMLGLSGHVTEAAFLALCEGLHPFTGQKLGQRMNTVRDAGGKSVANRRIFYDFTIAPPKSVSLVGLYQDVRILDLHRDAVRRTMTELEKFAETRVRKSGQKREIRTGNLVTACFRHDTSRELDPHLHTHCVVFNATFDASENRWKALDAGAMYKAQNFATSYYRHELSKGLRSLGYEIENHPRGFEIKGVPQSLVSRFSKRRKQIDLETCKRMEAGERPQNIKDLREEIAHGKRRQKLKEATAERLRPEWRSQLQPDEVAALAKLSAVSANQTKVSAKADVTAIMAWADEFLFERRSVVAEHELLAAALERGRGEQFDLAELHAAIEELGYVVETTTNRLTSREVLRTELNIVIAAKDGRCRHEAFNAGFTPADKLSPEQKKAVGQILGSRDFITLFRGGAGTGKSFTIKEVERGLLAASRPVVILAPQRQQVADLQADGLKAETLSRFLVAKQLTKGAVVIVDESGQIGGRQLHELIRVVQMNGGRLILSGDTRQHGAVPASDALRAIEKHAGLKPAVIGKIRRQDPALGESARERAFIRGYRSAVKAAAKGDITGSFDRLDQLGCIRDRAEDADERREQLAQEYLAAMERKEKVLVVAQTRAEVTAVNETIRGQLLARGKLGAEKMITAHQPVDMSEACKRDPRFYQPGQHAFFIRGYGRYAKNDLCEIVEANEHGLVLKKNGRRSTFSYRYTSRIAVAAPVELRIAPGDRLQLKFNGKSVEDAPLNNGELVTVQKLCPDGSLVVEGAGGIRKTLGPTQRVFVRGYAVTSYGSQGKTVDTVLIADANNETATNANQWYVSISRARKKVVVFTPDKAALREHIERTGDRELALELDSQKTVAVSLSEAQAHLLEAAEHQRRHQSVMANTFQLRTQTQRVSL